MNSPCLFVKMSFMEMEVELDIPIGSSCSDSRAIKEMEAYERLKRIIKAKHSIYISSSNCSKILKLLATDVGVMKAVLIVEKTIVDVATSRTTDLEISLFKTAALATTFRCDIFSRYDNIIAVDSRRLHQLCAY